MDWNIFSHRRMTMAYLSMKHFQLIIINSFGKPNDHGLCLCVCIGSSQRKREDEESQWNTKNCSVWTRLNTLDVLERHGKLNKYTEESSGHSFIEHTWFSICSFQIPRTHEEWYIILATKELRFGRGHESEAKGASSTC